MNTPEKKIYAGEPCLTTKTHSNAEVGNKEDASYLNSLRSSLLDWFRLKQRRLPWRDTRDPYAIWVSEVMLQQTRVAAVSERYVAFLERFPTVFNLAAATEAEVLTLWSGLGYYRRARQLHCAARQIVEHKAGEIPTTAGELLLLPGIGKYTAAAVASIAYSEPIAAIDGNVERVLQRLRGWGSEGASDQPAIARHISAEAQRLLDPAAPGDWNQAMMELGATVCLPRAPRCADCPIVSFCATRGEHVTPKRAPMRSESVAYALVVRNRGKTKQVLLVQRPAEETVMPGMWELPRDTGDHSPAAPMLELRHAIMQVNYKVEIYSATANGVSVDGKKHRWVDARSAAKLPLTGLARKTLLQSGMLNDDRP